jgi:hypothetical protein
MRAVPSIEITRPPRGTEVLDGEVLSPISAVTAPGARTGLLLVQVTAVLVVALRLVAAGSCQSSPALT